MKNAATLSRDALVRGLNMAADAMQSTSIVAKSDAWRSYYRDEMRAYRLAAELIKSGAKFVIKETKGSEP